MSPTSLSRVLEPLVRGEADVVVASICRESRGDHVPTPTGSQLVRRGWTGVARR